jgi:hypothetical protein
MKSATPEQAKAGMDAWMTWAGLVGSSYSILQAESKDALMSLLKNHPHFMAR